MAMAGIRVPRAAETIAMSEANVIAGLREAAPTASQAAAARAQADASEMSGYEAQLRRLRLQRRTINAKCAIAALGPPTPALKRPETAPSAYL